jgi:peptide/nickel transport system permease protein
VSRLILRRIAVFIPTLFIVTVGVFALRSLIPGGPAEALAGPEATASQIAGISRSFGLNRPIVDQYLSWVGGLLHGDFGVSYSTSAPVSTIISQRTPATLELVLGAFVIAVVVGGGAGMWGAIRNERLGGRAIFRLSRLGLSIPDFWLATVTAGVFGLALGWVPAVGFTSISESLLGNVHSLILPMLILSVSSGALIARHVYSSMGSALRSPYVRTAWAMGLSPRTVYFRCALPNAAAPIVTFLPLVIAGLVGASIVIENVFDIPGLGSEIISSVNNRDYSVLQAIVILLALVVLVLNLFADIAMAVIDPRVRHRH